jgi:pyruvate dehydrogenase E2 component (dihydrolipoamide acetyltransferase)
MLEFKMPSLGSDMDEGTLLEWRVQPGEQVQRGQIVAIVDTAKAAVDVECWQAGEVLELLIEPGAKVPVATPLMTLLEPGENRATASAQRPASAMPPEPPEPPAPPAAPAAVSAVVAPSVSAPAPAGRPRISPVARKRAAELGLDANSLSGSGPHGVVTLEDVEAASKAPASSARDAAMRQAIGAAMSRSKREIPHYYLSENIPLGALMDWLQTHNAGLAPEQRWLPAVLLLKAVALAVRDYPQLNGLWQDGGFNAASTSHLGIAIALRQGGLIAPALHDVADKPLAQLMVELSDLVQRARSGSLRSSELSDASLTVTQLGEQGVDSVLGVIYPPQVALVGFGRIAQRPWVEAGQLCVRPVVTASLAADHRASDGHYGARFLAALNRLLQTPENL